MFKKQIKSIKRLLSNKSDVGLPESLRKIIDDYDLPAVLTTYDSDSPLILYCNRKHAKLTGYAMDECVGKSPKMFQGKDTNLEVREEIRNSLKNSSFWNGYVTNYKKNGSAYTTNLIIFGVCFNHTKYYVALKRPDR